MTKTTPIKGWSEKILPEWTDYNRHMNVGYYTLIFDHGVDVFLKKLGLVEIIGRRVLGVLLQ